MAPIALFVYKRLDHLKMAVDSLLTNKESIHSDLYIFSDGHENIEQKCEIELVRDFIDTIEGFKSIKIIKHEENLGLAKSIIYGVNYVLKDNSCIIVIEDDLILSPFFLEYMNDGLKKFEKEDRVVSIHGFVIPMENELEAPFFLRGADCWGWATWRRGWKHFNPDGTYLMNEIDRRNLKNQFDWGGSYPYCQMLEDQVKGKNDSWAIRWHASAFLENMLTLYPNKTLVKNIGHDGSGAHSGISDIFDGAIFNQKIRIPDIPIIESLDGLAAYSHFCKKNISNNSLSRLLGRILNGIVTKVNRVKISD